ncbi:MAG: lasso peptide biosynthesis B2 protein [Pseudomonadota bacterium]|nr:lasso peptide biosynthesis B2 protein [Pseudomonadota bacterium]
MYYFASHAAGCETAEGAIFLDFRTGKYLGAPAVHLGAFRQCISEWPTPADAPKTTLASLSAADHSILAELSRKRLLTQSPPERPPLRARDIPTPTATLPHEVHDRISLTFRVWMDITLVLSIAYVCMNLKLNRLDGIIRNIESLRRHADARAPALETARLRTVVSRFRRISVWLYSRKDACLFDSLVLTRYLYWHRIMPTLVFGVSTKPFSAHAWVQICDVMLVDSAEAALLTTPIFAA